MDTQPLATTENLLHPRQTTELKDDKARLEGMLRAPDYVKAQLAGGGANVVKRIRDIDKVLLQAPEPIAADRLDEAVRQEMELREAWTTGMPTQAEMRRNAAGCVDKHTAWEKRSKKNVLKWKNLRRRLHASGISTHRLDSESDVSNIELYRPVGGAQELNMHNEQIPAKMMFLPPDGAAPPVVLTEADEAMLHRVAPGVLDKIGLASNEVRTEIIDLVRKLDAGTEAATEPKAKKSKKTKKTRKALSPEHKARLSARMKAMNEARRNAAKQPQAVEG